MLKLYLRSRHGLARARSSLVGPYLDGFAASLHDSGYCTRIGAWSITYAVHLGLWAAAESVTVSALDERALDAFLAHLPRCHCSGHRAGKHAAARSRTRIFLHYLRSEGIVAPPVREVGTPEPVTGFCRWLRQQRGVADTTLHQYRRVAVAIVKRMGDDPARYHADALRAAMRAMTGGHGVSTARFVAKVARALLRYLAMEGRCRPGLDAAIEPVASWSLASLPRYVSAETIERIIDACDPAQPCGVRDRAILVLLARLGLRGSDIVRMRLDDIDWEQARIRVTGKARREVSLPLPQEVGDALLAYLHVRRSGVRYDQVFLTSRAPWKPLAASSCVSAIARCAIQRAGVSAPTHGAHLLRHSVATAMLREGISLQSIGVVLRHRSIETTAYYAKVDVELLRSVAQPWMGGGVPC